MVEMTSNSRSSMASADVILGEAPASILLLYIWFAHTTNSAASCTKTTTELVPICGKLLLWLHPIAEKKRWRRTTRGSLSLSFPCLGRDGWMVVGGTNYAYKYSWKKFLMQNCEKKVFLFKNKLRRRSTFQKKLLLPSQIRAQKIMLT